LLRDVYSRMRKKFFTLDKNYILQEAQLLNQGAFLASLFEKARKNYLLLENPLGLEDDFILKIKNFKPRNYRFLHEFYERLSAVYRYRYDDSQLELIFDGRSHIDKYSEEWQIAFQKWTDDFCLDRVFLKNLIDFTVFYPNNRRVQLNGDSLTSYLHRYFKVRFYTRKGVQELHSA